MSEDLRLELRTRNNRLWHVIFDSAPNVAAWCRQHGFSNTEVGGFLNLTRTPYMSNGEPRPLVVRIAAHVGMLVEDLFPKDLYSGVFSQRLVAEIPSHAFRELAAARRLALPPAQEDAVLQRQLRSGIDVALSTLTPREERVLRARFGLDGHEQTLTEVGAAIGVTAQRARQIEAKGLRKLRHASRRHKLLPYIDAVAGALHDDEPASDADSDDDDG